MNLYLTSLPSRFICLALGCLVRMRRPAIALTIRKACFMLLTGALSLIYQCFFLLATLVSLTFALGALELLPSTSAWSVLP